MSATDRTQRLFIGIALDARTRARCAGVADRLRRAGYEARYAEPDNYHVTLAFLGNVAASKVNVVVEALADVAKAHPPFTVRFDRLSAFPQARRPRVVFIGARDQPAAYRNLAHDLRSRYGELGFTFESDPVAHVTIARIKGCGRPLPGIDLSGFEVPVDALSLFESLFDPSTGTTRYRIDRTTHLHKTRHRDPGEP